MPSMLLAYRQDSLIPWTEMQSLAATIGAHSPVHFEALSSPFGHDAFLKEFDEINERLRVMLDTPIDANPVSALRQWMSHASH